MIIRVRCNLNDLAAAIRSESRRIVAAVQPLHRAHRFLLPAAIGAAAFVICTLSWFIYGVVAGIPDTSVLHNVGTMPQASVLLDVNGREAFAIFREQRISVPLSRISPHVVRALIAFEDQRFYDHSGLDIVRLAGAALSNLQEGRKAQGGSTLTQQLARQSFLTPVKTMRRKLTEIVIAAWLEHEYSKEQILEYYLNKVYFGDGLYGIEAASLGYFGKHAADVDAAEAALLVGLLKSPSTYAPTVKIDRAVARRNLVLRAMRDVGAIDQPAFDAAIAEPVQLTDALRRKEAHGLYFKEEVRTALVELFGQERVLQGGLKVYTTLDIDMQIAAEAEVARTIAEIEQRQAKQRGKAPVDGEPLQAALLAMDPHTGEVRAMVGGRDFYQSHFNRATQAHRQPGSAFKPFVYAAALEMGFSPATLLTNLDDPTMTPQGLWVPEDEHLESSSMTMRTALRTSSNRAAVQMLREIGIPATVRYAGLLGMGLVPSVPSLALGSGEVTLLSMTAAYGAFANAGILPAPTLIRRVEATDGHVLFTADARQQRALSATTAFLMTTMLADVVNSGTAWPARRVGFMLPAAGKTGTTNEYRDAWFIGYTPHIVAGVWVGYDRPKTIIGRGYAGELAVPLWGRFMIQATRHDEPDWFRAPGDVTSATICRLSGQLATDKCRDAELVDAEGNPLRGSPVYTEYFLRGTEPLEFCAIHGLHLIGEREEVTKVGSIEPHPEPTLVPAVATIPVPATSTSTKISDGLLTRPEPTSEPAPTRRRGFWGRVFGR